jgi:hypothetical protein
MFCYGLTVGSNPSTKYCSAYVLFKEGYGLKHAAIAMEQKKDPVTQRQAVIMAMAMGANALNPGRQGVMIHTNIKTLADSLNKGDNKYLLVYTITDYIRGLGRGFKAEYTPTSHPYMELAQQLAREQHDTFKGVKA